MIHRPKPTSVFLLIFLCFWAFSNLSALQEEPVEQSHYVRSIKAIQRFVDEQMALDKTPGLSVGFLKDDFTWTQGFGYADLENRVPAQPQSSYRMASITKTFTATAVLQLMEAGKMNLSADIQTYVPYFPHKKWPITVRQLLGHMGGIPHYVDREKELHIKEHRTTREAVAIFQDYDLIAEPGTKYYYSSYGYNLLGAAIEEVSGQSYGPYIKEHIFAPLGMEDTRMDDPSALIPNRVKGYRLMNGTVVNSEYIDTSSRFAAGGTRSTVVDLLKYARGIIDGKLLHEETWRLMFEPLATGDGILTGKGLCWNVSPWKGHFQIFHGGSQQETRTFLMIFPQEKFALAVASNMENFDRELYVKKIADFILEEDLDTPTYVSDERQESLYAACEQAFSYGLSQYEWHKRPLALNTDEIKKAFSYFNQNVSLTALRRNPGLTKSRMSLGIHPIAQQAFIKVGSFMASVLDKTLGREKLHSYHKTGPIAFFTDYARLTQNLPPSNQAYKLSSPFEKMLFQWEKDRAKIFADDMFNFSIPFDVDFEELRLDLEQSLSGSSLYPDFHQDMIRAAQYHLQHNDPQQALLFLKLAVELYPNRADPWASLASLYIWTGNGKEAKRCFMKTFAQNPDHPGASSYRFIELARNLVNARKFEQLHVLAEIAAELHPRSWELLRDLGDTFLRIGQKEAAFQYYKKAFKLNPEFKEGRQKIKALEKELKK
jgi:CubicO group peptidase (beta-lactamase class C family)